MDSPRATELRPILDLLDRAVCQPNGVAQAFWGLQLITKIKENEMTPQSVKASCEFVRSHHAMATYIKEADSIIEAWKRYLFLCDTANNLLAWGLEMNIIKLNNKFNASWPKASAKVSSQNKNFLTCIQATKAHPHLASFFLRARHCYQAAYDPSLNIFPPQLWLFNPNKKAGSAWSIKNIFNLILLL